MIDLHCHLLPGIDDGPATMAEAIVLAEIAVADGISHSVVTPHIHPGRYENDVMSITTAYNGLVDALSKHAIPLALSMAAEVRLSAEILTQVVTHKIPFYGHGLIDDEAANNTYRQRVMLLEMPHQQILPGSDNLVAWLLKQNITPMIAHPERNKEVMRNPDKIASFVEQGCLLQVTGGSVAGRFGDIAKKTADYLLGKGWVTVLASDAHNAKARRPVLSEGREAAAGIVGDAAANQLVTTNPQKILQGLIPQAVTPQ